NKFLYISYIFEEKYGYCLNSSKLNIYKNSTKEICESMSALIHTLKYCDEDIKNNKILCLVIADGISPKTGILFALNTNWNIHVIDPIMDDKWVNGKFKNIIPNMVCYRNKIEEIDDNIFKNNIGFEKLIIIGVHSHANLNLLWEKIIYNFPQVSIFLLSIPCCNGFEHYVKKQDPFINIIDYAIPS